MWQQRIEYRKNKINLDTFEMTLVERISLFGQRFNIILLTLLVCPIAITVEPQSETP